MHRRAFLNAGDPIKPLAITTALELPMVSTRACSTTEMKTKVPHWQEKAFSQKPKSHLSPSLSVSLSLALTGGRDKKEEERKKRKRRRKKEKKVARDDSTAFLLLPPNSHVGIAEKGKWRLHGSEQNLCTKIAQNFFSSLQTANNPNNSQKHAR